MCSLTETKIKAEPPAMPLYAWSKKQHQQLEASLNWKLWIPQGKDWGGQAPVHDLLSRLVMEGFAVVKHQAEICWV